MISDHQIQNMGMTYPGCLFSSLDAQVEIRYVFRESVPAPIWLVQVNDIICHIPLQVCLLCVSYSSCAHSILLFPSIVLPLLPKGRCLEVSFFVLDSVNLLILFTHRRAMCLINSNGFCFIVVKLPKCSSFLETNNVLIIWSRPCLALFLFAQQMSSTMSYTRSCMTLYTIS